MTPRNPTLTRLWLVVGLGIWFVIVQVLSVLDFWQRAGIVIPKVVGLLVLAQLFILWRVPRLRELLIDGDPRWLLSVHTMRFVGILFLVMHGRGELPWAFAVPGGWGDIVIATGAVLLLLFAFPLRTPTGRMVLLLWNVAGLIDILFVVSTALRLFLGDPLSMSALARLPLCLLPTFFVPLIIVSHLLLFVWIRRHPMPAAGAGSAEARLPH